MLADVPQMSWFASIKMLLWRFVDKMDGNGGHAAIAPAWPSPAGSGPLFRFELGETIVRPALSAWALRFKTADRQEAVWYTSG
jgi:hypothetical protein